MNSLWSGCGKYQACPMCELRLAPKHALHDTSLVYLCAHRHSKRNTVSSYFASSKPERNSVLISTTQQKKLSDPFYIEDPSLNQLTTNHESFRASTLDTTECQSSYYQRSPCLNLTFEFWQIGSELFGYWHIYVPYFKLNGCNEYGMRSCRYHAVVDHQKLKLNIAHHC